MSLRKIKCLPLIAAFLLSIAAANLAYAPGAVIYISPAQNIYNPGDMFTISVMISGVTNCWAWELRITWDPGILEVNSVTEGAFLSSGGMTFFAKDIDNIFGEALFGSTLMGAPSGVSGSGELASVSFTVEEAGKCPLGVTDTMLVDKSMVDIAHSYTDGYFATPQEASLVARSAWPEHHHYKIYPGDEDEYLTLNAKVKNLGPSDLYVRVDFACVRDDGYVADILTDPIVVPAGTIVTVSANLGPLTSLDAGKWAIQVMCFYSFYGVWPYVAQGDKVKTFSVAVVP